MTTANLSNLRIVISRYKHAVNSIVKQMRSDFGRNDLLRGWRESSYPMEGKFGHNGEMRYSFHGVGCFVTTDKIEVNFDFGHDGRVDGFDAWRLYLFAKHFPGEFPGLESSEAIQAGLNELINAGELICPGVLPNRSLMYTTDAFKHRI